MGGRDVSRRFQAQFAGDVANNGNGDYAVAVHMATRCQEAFQEGFLQRRAADSRIPSQGDFAPSGKRSEGDTHAPCQILCEIGTVDTTDIISSKDSHGPPSDPSI